MRLFVAPHCNALQLIMNAVQKMPSCGEEPSDDKAETAGNAAENGGAQQASAHDAVALGKTGNGEASPVGLASGCHQEAVCHNHQKSPHRIAIRKHRPSAEILARAPQGMMQPLRMVHIVTTPLCACWATVGARSLDIYLSISITIVNSPLCCVSFLLPFQLVLLRLCPTGDIIKPKAGVDAMMGDGGGPQCPSDTASSTHHHDQHRHDDSKPHQSPSGTAAGDGYLLNKGHAADSSVAAATSRQPTRLAGPALMEDLAMDQIKSYQVQ